MKIQTALSACIAMLLGGCASYSGNSYRSDVAYDDRYYDAPDQRDDAYYGETYYDDSSDYYGGSFGFGYNDPFRFGGYGYCSPRYAICPGDPLALFLFPIGGGRYWLLFDGFDDRSYFYGGGYGWPYSYWWGNPYWHHDHDDDGHHHHHHHDHDPPDPVVVTPPGGQPPNGWVPSPRDGRRYGTTHPRKGVFTINGAPQPRTDRGLADSDNDNDYREPPARVRRDDGGGNEPPMRWRPPPTLVDRGPTDRPVPIRVAPEPVRMPRQVAVAPSDQTRLYVAEPARPTRPQDTSTIAPSRSYSAPEPRPIDVPRQDSDDRTDRVRRRGDGDG